MAMSTAQLKVPFVDLKAQYANIRDEVLAAIQDVVDSAHFIGGPWLDKFEGEFADYVGAKYAIGLSSGTSALELALKAAGIGPGDEVIVPANTFFATAEAVSNIGATPVFADVVSETFHVDVSSVAEHITRRTKAIIPVHLYGRAMDLTQLLELSRETGLLIIEDAAQAHGSSWNGARVGSSGRLCCFSFYPGKNLGAYGDAGAVTTDDPELAIRLKMLRDHGSRVKYEHPLIGTNARLDSIQAAVLAVKLPYLDNWNHLRFRHAQRYASALAGSSVRPPTIPQEGSHNFHLFVVRSPHRDALAAFLGERGISTGIHYPTPLHLTEAYGKMGYGKKGTLPVSEELATHILSLPMFPELTEEQIDYVVETILEFKP
jgi:dTDP-4-amino-4,6-dideoxygalactose transaminase